MVEAEFQDNGNPRGEGSSMAVSPLVGPVLTGLVLLAVFIGGIFGINYFVENQQQRDRQQWQVRLGIMADAKVSQVESWLTAQFQSLDRLAENAALQIYVTELSMADGNPELLAAVEGEAEYLRNLLIVTADRSGFANSDAGDGLVRANVASVGRSGIALVDADGKTFVSTPGMPPMDFGSSGNSRASGLQEFLAGMAAGGKRLRNLYRGTDGALTAAFGAPVYAVQADRGADAPIGFLLAVKQVGPELFPLLKQNPGSPQSSEAMLVRRAGPLVEFLSPRGEFAPLANSMAVDTPDLAAAFAVNLPGGFAEQRDYRGEQVLVTGRIISQTPWVLVEKIDSGEALGESFARANRLRVSLLSIVVLVAVVLIAVWRHGASRRSNAAAHQLQIVADGLEEQRKMLRLVTDSQPNKIFIVDEEGRYVFANERTAEDLGVDVADLIGKTMVSVLGPDAARRYSRMNEDAISHGKVVARTSRLGNGAGGNGGAVNSLAGQGDDSGRVVFTEHIPVALRNGVVKEVLVVEQDITDPIVERERRTRTLDQLVDTLVAIVDRRDPFAANHSAQVADLARAMAQEIGLEEDMIRTAAIAGNLMNLGKIFVSESLLTKTERLSEDEVDQVRKSLMEGTRLLEKIEFNGPVVETIWQTGERVDGSGYPGGLLDNDILVTAQIVAVANAFVGMISPRAYREGLDIDEVMANLQAGIGTAYRSSVVTALANYIENRGGRQRWAQ